MNFYGEVLRELVFALGAALFVANILALLRRKRDRAAIPVKIVAKSRPGSPVRAVNRANTGDLAVAPLARTVLYAVIGLFVMIWGFASLFM